MIKHPYQQILETGELVYFKCWESLNLTGYAAKLQDPCIVLVHDPPAKNHIELRYNKNFVFNIIEHMYEFKGFISIYDYKLEQWCYENEQTK